MTNLVIFLFFDMSKKEVILVTGGTGLVGHGIQLYLEQGHKRENEEWVFLSSKDCNLKYASLPGSHP